MRLTEIRFAGFGSQGVVLAASCGGKAAARHAMQRSESNPAKYPTINNRKSIPGAKPGRPMVLA